MIPPKATQAGPSATAGDTPAAVSLHPIETLRIRADFLKANHGRRQNAPAFGLQARRRSDAAGDPANCNHLIRVGFTCSKKVGNAVARNRAKRRLREIARQILPHQGQPGWDYVLIGRPGSTINRPFADLRADLETALLRIHAQRVRK